MKSQRISTKIKTLGFLFFILVVALIATTIYLNKKSKQDALIINIAGKERMLSQRIAKNIFYTFHMNSQDFTELDSAVDEFVFGLNALKDGNESLEIESVPTQTIAMQFYVIEVLWDNYLKNVEEFKTHMINSGATSMGLALNNLHNIYNTNNVLLFEVDKLVTMYTNHAQRKTQYIIYFQYGAAFTLLVLFVYGFFKLRTIELNAQHFLESTKQLIDSESVEEIKPLKVQGESEIAEVSDTINCFINKINSAMNYSAQAIEQSRQASMQLEDITDEFDQILDSMKDSANISKQLNHSEDMVIESTEELMNSTRRLQELKDQLDRLKLGCLNNEQIKKES